MSTPLRSALLATTGLLFAACSGSTDSSTPAPGADSTIVPTSESTAPVVESSVADGDPPTSEPPATAPPPTDAPVPVTDAPAPVIADPTAGTTVVHVGTDFGGAWTPIALWDGSGWSQADYADDGSIIVLPPSDFATVSVASLGLPAPVSGLAYGPPDFVCVDDRTGPSLDVGVPIGEIASSFGYTAVSVAGDWNVQPRPVDQVGLDAPEYQTLGESLVTAAGVDPTGGDVTQVVRADLDGNGVEEVLVTFEKVTEGFGSAGDFSLVIARYPTSAGVVVDELLFEYYPDGGEDFPTLGSGAVLAVADLNGDAVMEVVLRSSFWETALADVYSFDGGALTAVAGGGCGT